MKTDWEVKTLGSLSKINYGYTEKASFDEIGPKFLRITDIQEEGVNWSTVPFCVIEENVSQKYLLAENDIVFARTGATTGKSYLIKNPPSAVFASYLIRLKIINQKQIFPQFLYLFFQTQTYWDFIQSGISGSAQGGFNASKLAELEIPLPPLPEQQRIVAILDEAFAAIDTAKANAETNRQNARALFESYLQLVFANPGEGWEEKTLGDICERITKGSSPNWQGIKYVETPGILFITSENVGEHELLLNKKKYVEERFNSIEKKSILRYGDVLTNIVGASIGRTAIFNLTEIANINQAVCILRCRPDILNNLFLSFLLNSPFFRDILHDNEVDNARANLSLGFFSGLSIPVPSLEEQRNLVAKFNALSTETKKLEALYQQKLIDLDELKKSILQKAFRGELTNTPGAGACSQGDALC